MNATRTYNVAPDPKDSTTLPIGSITLYGASTPPSGWLLCDGSAVSRTSYAALFAVISTVYGTGDGLTTFNIPNTSGKTIRGVNGTYTIGSAGGADTVTLAVNQVPPHGHSITDPGHNHVYQYGSGTNIISSGSTGVAQATPNNNYNTSTSVTGITLNTNSLLNSGSAVTPQVAVSLANTYVSIPYIIKAA